MLKLFFPNKIIPSSSEGFAQKYFSSGAEQLSEHQGQTPTRNPLYAVPIASYFPLIDSVRDMTSEY